MNPKIIKIPMGVGNSYLIEEEGLIMVDSGSIPKAKGFLDRLEKQSIDPRQVALVVLTHGHWDHIAGMSEIKKLTGAKAAINHREKSWLESATPPLSPPLNLWGSFFGLMLKMIVPMVSYSGTQADVIMDDEGLSLEEYGIKGRVLYTPGHTEGSMSVLLESGDAFVGDLAMNGMPMRFGPGKPIFATSENQVKESWKLLLNHGAKTIYPFHGEPFSATKLEKSI